MPPSKEPHELVAQLILDGVALRDAFLEADLPALRHQLRKITNRATATGDRKLAAAARVALSMASNESRISAELRRAMEDFWAQLDRWSAGLPPRDAL